VAPADPSIDNGGNTDQEFPQIAMDNSGNAIIFWQLNTGGGSYIMKSARSSDFGASWTNITTVDAVVSTDLPNFPQIQMDESGNAIAVWGFFNGASFFTKIAYSSDYGATWSPPTTLDPLSVNTDVTYPQLDMDNFGNAIIVWNADVGGPFVIKTMRSSDFGKTWTNLMILDAANTSGDARTFPQVEMDDFGNAVVVWNRNTGGDTFDIKAANSLDLGTTWTITTLAAGVVTDWWPNIPRVEVAMDDSSNKNAIHQIAIWSSSESGPNSSTVVVNSFQSHILSVLGKQQQIKDFLQITLRNRIGTEIIDREGTFRLYRDAALTQLVEEISNPTRDAAFFDYDVSIGESKTYYITWTASTGNIIIGPVSVTING